MLMSLFLVVLFACSNNHDPDFKTKLSVDHFSGADRELRLDAYDVDYPIDHVWEEKYMGSGFVQLSALAAQQGQIVVLPLKDLRKNGAPVGSGKRTATILVTLDGLHKKGTEVKKKVCLFLLFWSLWFSTV